MHLAIYSRKMVINRNIDILMKENPKDINEYKKPTAMIKELKLKWNESVGEKRKLL